MKFCYILPEYDENTHRHYLYLYELIEEISRRHNCALVIENLKSSISLKNPAKIIALKSVGFFKRKKELLIVLVNLWRDGYRVFYSHYSHLGAIFSGIITRLFGGESYFWHCIEIKEFFRDPTRAGGKPPSFFARWLFKFRLKLTLLLVKHLVTGSEFMANYYVENIKVKREKIFVLPNWINIQRIQEGLKRSENLKQQLKIPKGHYVILFVHGLFYGKGAHFLPFIIEQTCQSLKDVVFVIIGDGFYRKNLEKEVKERGLEDKVRLLGNLPNREIPAYLGIADLLIMPSKFEAFSRVLLEAMAAGVPFVSTDGGGGIKAYTSNIQQEFVLPRGEIYYFPEKIVSLLLNEEKRKFLSQHGREYVKNYDLPSAIERFERLIIKSIED